MAGAALKHCLSFLDVSTVIPGMRKVRHVQENVRAADGVYYGAGPIERLKAHAWVRNDY